MTVACKNNDGFLDDSTVQFLTS